MSEIYTPMEKILIEGAKKLSTAEVCARALETKKDFNTALLLDALLQEMEEEQGLFDGLPAETWLL